MITPKQYNEALIIVDQYRKQLRSSDTELDVYEWLRATMMASGDITLEEFEEALQTWVNIKKKELSVANCLNINQ